ncbi:hypothetical protein ABZ490_17735 [Streptomyces sp. NPDC005811]|uniref:hypothetical protein n=1 Tax=Streptomyces sp. NPDC005811 TaxID=3154565 RepID=UPI00340803DE
MDGDEGDTGNGRNDQVVDWLELSPDLPHLIARVSELVLSLGYDPEDLVTLPRGELDRRELAAYSAGWADMVAEQLPAIRRAYEERITVAYLQGQEDARTGRRPRRAARPAEEDDAGGEVIALPYVELLRPPTEVTRAEERGERERSVADGGPVPVPAPVSVPVPVQTPLPVGNSGPGGGGSGGPGAGEPPPAVAPVPEKRTVRSARRTVVRRNGRPSVPPLSRSRERRTDAGERAQQESAASEEKPRLSDRARALADGLEGRGQGRGRGRRGDGRGAEPPESPEAPGPG